MAGKPVSEEKRHDEIAETLTAPSQTLEEDFEAEYAPQEATGDRPKRWVVPLLMGVGIGLVVAVGATQLLPAKSGRAPQAGATPTAAVAPSMSVTVAPVETTTVAQTLDATGTVAAYDLLPVLSQVSGLQVKQVLAEEGAFVRVGQILAVLDNSVLQTQLSQSLAQLEASKSGVGQKQAALGQARAGVAQAQAGVAQAQANFAQSRANLGQVERALKRYKTLASQGAISLQDLDTRVTAVQTAAQAAQVAKANISSAEAGISNARAAISSAEANVRSAEADVRNSEARVQQIKTQIGQTQVLAPASGIVAEKIARVGDVTSGNQKLFSIIRDGIVELQLKIPDTQLSEVRVGAPVRVTSNADARIRFLGKVREIAPTVDQQSRQATVKIDLPSSSLLKPGMFLRAAITAETAQGLTIPAKAVMRQADGKAIVYVLEGNDTARAQTVEVGTTAGGTSGDLSTARVEIKSGLKAGDRAIVKGAGYLKDGEKVQVVNSQ